MGLAAHNHLFIYLADYINDGVYGAFNCILFDHQKVSPFALTVGGSPVWSLPGTQEMSRGSPIRDLVSASLWGPTCDSIDCVCPVTSLPRLLEVGDWLGFRNMGAYTLCAASQFNGFQQSTVVYTSGVGVMSDRTRALLRLSADRK